MNALIATLTNYFYCSLSREDFVCLSIFLRELSRMMVATSVFEELCPEEKN